MVVRRVGLDGSDGIQNVLQPLIVGSRALHTGTASRSTFSRECGRMSLCSEISSTVQPTPAAKALTARLHDDAATCEKCKKPEWLCACAKKDAKAQKTK